MNQVTIDDFIFWLFFLLFGPVGYVLYHFLIRAYVRKSSRRR